MLRRPLYRRPELVRAARPRGYARMKIEILSTALTAGYFLAMAIPPAMLLCVRRPAAPLPRALLLVFGSAAAMALLVVFKRLKLKKIWC